MCMTSQVAAEPLGTLLVNAVFDLFKLRRKVMSHIASRRNLQISLLCILILRGGCDWHVTLSLRGLGR